MYTLLLLLGFGFIVYGMILEKRERKPQHIPFEETKSGEFQDAASEWGQDSEEELPVSLQTNLLEAGPSSQEWDDSEKPLFSEVLEQQMDQDKARLLLDVNELAMERKRIIEGLDQGTYSVDLVCSLLNMEKGEVLLLKNISNKFGK